MLHSNASPMLADILECAMPHAFVGRAPSVSWAFEWREGVSRRLGIAPLRLPFLRALPSSVWPTIRELNPLLYTAPSGRICPAVLSESQQRALTDRRACRRYCTREVGS
jgi:hypothetical protein